MVETKNKVNFILTTAIGGIVFLVPMVALGFVLLKLGTAERIGFEVQKLEDGRSMVFLPSSPNPFSGVTQVLPPDQIVYLDVPVNRVIEVTENFGHGFEKLVDSQNQASKS